LTAAQILDRVLTCYRIGDPAGEFPIFSAEGSRRHPGRWNTAACPIIYTSEHYSTAMLEKLVHGSGSMPPSQHYIQITIPNGLTYEMLDTARLPDWASPDGSSSRAHGDAWTKSNRSLLLIVPSVVARVDMNVLINPAHPQFGKIKTSLHKPIWWDSRLFD
jgi:RES domain-containing protein